MDVLNEKDISAVIVTPALDKLRTELVPALQTAVHVELSNAVVQVSDVLNATILALQGAADKAVADLRATVAALDGWTLTITVPAITIRLTAPK